MDTAFLEETIVIKRTDLLSIDITLQCNLMCKGCNKFVYHQYSDTYIMTEDELNTIMTLVAPKTTAKYIRVIGGEPLVHPNFEHIVHIIQSYGYQVELATNGTLLPLYSDNLLNTLIAIKITDYGKRNSRIIKQYQSRPNVTIINSLENWRDPEAEKDINLSEIDGKIAYNRCPMGTIKVCNWQIWDCCAAEAIERHYELEPTYVKLDEDWYENLDKSSRATTCQRCYFGKDTIRHLKEIKEYERERFRV